MPSVSAAESDADCGHFGVPPVGARSDRNGFVRLSPDLQKLRSIESVGDGQSSAQMFSQYSVN